MKKLSIVLPTFNEKDNLEKTVKAIFEQEKKLHGWKFDIVVSDSHSTDGTGDLAKKLSQQNSKIHYLDVERGIGVGLIKGHQYALKHLQPDIMAQIDADGQVEPDILPRMIETIESGYNLVLGSRFVKGGRNELSFSRRLFTYCSSLVCRLIMGPFDIREYTNSARALTPQLFQKINLNRLPWKEKTFINQPAFLNEAVLAGAKYKEIPLVFKDRAEGYSKNKVVNYTYDVVTYALDARLHKLGIDIPFFYYSRRVKTLIKFALVGFSGTLVDFGFYNLLISYFALRPATSKGISTEIAIVNNFILNNIWTFRHRKTEHNLVNKAIIFNLVSLGGLAIGVLLIKFLHTIYGDGVANIFGINIPYYNIYFFASILPIMVWNFTVNHFVTFRHKTAATASSH